MSTPGQKVQRVPAEVRFAEELRRLAATDSHEVPPGWRLSPIAVELNTWLSATSQGFRLNVIIQDIRQRQAIEQALRDSQQRLQTITDNLPVLIAYVDRELRYQFNNATYGLWYGWSAAELHNRPVRDLYPATEYAHFLPFMELALQGETQRFERSEQRADGVHHLYSIYIPHRREQEVVGFYVLSQDITPRKQLELELKRHALNDPLTGLPQPALLDGAAAQSHGQKQPHRTDDGVTVYGSGWLQSHQ